MIRYDTHFDTFIPHWFTFKSARKGNESKGATSTTNEKKIQQWNFPVKHEQNVFLNVLIIFSRTTRMRKFSIFKMIGTNLITMFSVVARNANFFYAHNVPPE